MRAATTLLMLTLLTMPLANAWPWDPVAITVAPGHAGEVRRYEERSPGGASTLLVRLEGAGAAADRFGIPRDVETYRADRLDANGTLASATRCHQLAGGNVSVLIEPLTGWGGSVGSAVTPGFGPVALGEWRFEHDWTIEALYFGFPCEGWSPLAGRALTEGDRLALAETGLVFGDRDARSRPAEAVEFHGRPALRFAFDLRQVTPDLPADASGEFAFTYADGLPAPARMTMRAERAGEVEEASLELVGFEPGTGEAYAPHAGATLPDANPAAEFEPYRKMAVPDEAYAFPYASRDALASLLADPRVGLKAWLDAHPDAVLRSASYVRDGRGAGPEGVGTPEGMWSFEFVSGAAAYGAATARTRLADGPLGPLAQPPLLDQWGGPMEAFEPAPERIVDAALTSRALADLGAAQGFPPALVREFRYALQQGVTAAPAPVDAPQPARPIVQLEAPDRRTGGEDESAARHADLDAAAGAVLMLYRTRTTTTSTGPLDPLPKAGALGAEREASALAALAGPGVGVGLGVGAAAGVALLVVAAKFLLVPLFTRLVRARLLDNPVRARLYERIRAEPGIRQAELVDYLGVGEGAARHHLAQLVRHRYVVESREAGAPSYYAAGEVPPDVARRAAVLRSASARRVYDAYAAAPAMSLREAAAVLGMSAPSVHRQKRKLEDAGLLPAAPVVSPRP